MTSAPPIRVEGTFKHAQGKFWHLNSPSTSASPSPFVERPEGRPPIVAVFDPHKMDYRIKMWLRPSLPIDDTFEFSGHVIELEPGPTPAAPRRAHVDRRALWAILHGNPPVTDIEDEEDGREELRDYCIETRFELDKRIPRGHPGSVDDFPEWMQASSITISEDRGGGGPMIWLQTTLSTSHPDFADMIHGLRINGFWCVGMPTDGAVLFSPTPNQAAEIRMFGERDVDIEMENEIRPPRTRHLVRHLYNFLKEHGSTKGMDAWNWRDDVMKMQYAVLGMGISWGQRKYYADRRDALGDRRKHWTECLARHFKKRPKAYSKYTMDEWIDEVGKEPVKWRGRITEIRAAECVCEEREKSLHDSYEKNRIIYEERLARVEEREEKFADVIEMIHPRETS